LDKATGKEESRAVAIRLFRKENPSYDEIRAFIENLFEDTLKEFDKTINSRWTWGNRKRLLGITRGLFSMHLRSIILSVDIGEEVDRLNKAVVLLDEKIEKNQIKSKELEDVLSKIKITLAEPRIAKVASVMEQIERQMEERKKASEAYCD
jgi:hypothetical protein